MYIYIHTSRIPSLVVVARVPERAELAQRHCARLREHPHCASGQQGGTAQRDCRTTSVTFSKGMGFAWIQNAVEIEIIIGMRGLILTLVGVYVVVCVYICICMSLFQIYRYVCIIVYETCNMHIYVCILYTYMYVYYIHIYMYIYIYICIYVYKRYLMLFF